LREASSSQIQRSPEQAVHALSWRAQAFLEKGSYREAAACHLRALAAAGEVFGTDHLEVAAVLNNLGVVYKYLARFTEARRVAPTPSVRASSR
jgi:hypothetical protein